MKLKINKINTLNINKNKDFFITEIQEKIKNSGSKNFEEFLTFLEKSGDIIYHGTSARNEFKKFKGKEIYFTNNIKTARGFSEDRSHEDIKKYNINSEHSKDYGKFWDEDGWLKHKIYKVYKGNMENFLHIHCEGRDWDDIKTPDEMGGKGIRTTDQITRWARNNGYNGVFYEKIIDGSSYSSEDNFVFFYPEEIIMEEEIKEIFDKK